MKIFRYRLTPVFLVLWLLSLGLLYHEVNSQSFLVKDAHIDINDGALIMRQDYLGYYLGENKVGYSEFVLKEDNEDSLTKLPGKYYIFHSNTFLQIQAIVTLTMKIIQTGEVNEDLSMRSFSLTYESSGQQLYVMGTMEEDGLRVTTKSEGAKNQRTLPIHPPIYHTDMVHLLLAREGLEVGKKKIYPVYDPLTMSQGNIVATVEAKETVTLPDDKKVEAFKVDMNYKGLHTMSWLNKEGDLFKEISQVSGLNFTGIRETSEQARNLAYVSKGVGKVEGKPGENQPSPSQDLIDASRIKTKVSLPRPEKVDELRLKIIGAEKEDLIFDGSFQTLEKEEKDAVIVRIHKKDYAAVISSLKESRPPFEEKNPAVKEYLQNDLLIQSSDPRLREKGLEITKEAKNPWAASVLIAKWLYTNIRKEMRATIPDALEVLTTMKGDCNEHSTLFAGLARAIGIPTKLCAGLVYQEDGFYYHAWDEVFVDGQWLPIDSTLNRLEMDAAHIKLAEGMLDSQINFAKLIGNLQIEILDFKES